MNKSPRAHLSNDIQNYYQGQKWLIGSQVCGKMYEKALHLRNVGQKEFKTCTFRLLISV